MILLGVIHRLIKHFISLRWLLNANTTSAILPCEKACEPLPYAMPRKILTYFLSLWYLLLFQIYPIVHLHWHDGDGLETCFIAVEYNRADHLAHQNLHTAKAEQFVAHKTSPNCDHLHITVPVDDCAEQCHHLHVKADYDHFELKDNDSDKRYRYVEVVLCGMDSPQFPDQPQKYNPLSTCNFSDYYHKILSNKSPPLC